MSLQLEGVCPSIAEEGMVLGCHVYENILFSSIRAFRRHEPVWSVIHDPDGEQLDVQGDPPPQFLEIKRRLEAKEEAGDGSVDYIFDLPTKLAHSICGYDPSEMVEAEWSTLLKKRPGTERPPNRRPLAEAMRSELLPSLQARGWTFATEKPALAMPWQIFRVIGDQRQTIYFDFVSGFETYISVRFQTEGPRPSGRDHEVLGIIPPPGEPRSFWKRLTSVWKAPPTDPIPAVIGSAMNDIAIAEAFLETDEQTPRIRLYRAVDIPDA